jgi:SpoVK/Ycf46/Vps4 family AAA+-type ATPase
MFHHGRSPGSRKVFGGGVLLASSPGTGKSTLAYFCPSFATVLNPAVRLIDIRCNSLIHQEVGGSERALHRMFQIARATTPCIVVMDNSDNIAGVRGRDNTTEGTMDRLLSTLLTELDGIADDFDHQETGETSPLSCFAVIGITHNHRWIDPALRRPGRLERVITLDNPETKARKAIVLKELKDILYLPDGSRPDMATLDFAAERVARETELLSGADVVAVCNEGKLLAFK